MTSDQRVNENDRQSFAFCDSYFWECRLIDELDDERTMSNERGGRVSIQMSFFIFSD